MRSINPWSNALAVAGATLTTRILTRRQENRRTILSVWPKRDAIVVGVTLGMNAISYCVLR